MTVRISLLHATHHREGGPLAVKERWLALAQEPDLVDYIFAMDGDDAESIRCTEGHRRIIGSVESGVTAVRNWNNAATLADGELLAVIADDLVPGKDWDADLRRVINRLDPATTPFVVKVKDSERSTGVVLRHPVVSRAFFEKYGLFNPKFRGVYCDDDITLRAFWRSAILDGRSIEFVHDHPFGSENVQASASQTRINADTEYEHGRQVFEREWTERQRAASVRLVNPNLGGRGNAILTMLAARGRLRARVVYLLKSLRPIRAAIGRRAT